MSRLSIVGLKYLTRGETLEGIGKLGKIHVSVTILMFINTTADRLMQRIFNTINYLTDLTLDFSKWQKIDDQNKT